MYLTTSETEYTRTVVVPLPLIHKSRNKLRDLWINEIYLASGATGVLSVTCPLIASRLAFIRASRSDFLAAKSRTILPL